MTKKEVKNAEKRLLENGIKWWEFEEWITWNRKYLPKNATLEDEIECAIEKMEHRDIELAELSQKVFGYKDFAKEMCQKATIKQLKKFIDATNKISGISKWRKKDCVYCAMRIFMNFFEENETEADLPVVKTARSEKKLSRITADMYSDYYHEAYVDEDKVEELVAQNIEQVKACETREEMRELLMTTNKNMLSEMFFGIGGGTETGEGYSHYRKSDYVDGIIGYVFYERNKAKEAETLTTLKAVQECKTEGQMQEILETKSNETLYEMALELDEKITNREREYLIARIVILTIFGVLPRSERRCR